MKKIKKRSLFVIFISIALCICLSVTAVFAFKDGGSFKTDSGSYLNLRIDWAVEQSDATETADVTAKVYLDCYSIFVGARTNNTVSINGSKKIFETPAMQYEDNTFHSILLTEYTTTVQHISGIATECVIKADWTFNGIYGGKEIGVLEVEKTLVITDNDVTVIGTQKSDDKAAEDISSLDTVVPETEPQLPETDAVGGPEYSRIFELSSESGAYLNLICDIQISDSIENENKLTAVAELYLDYYSLYISEKKDCKFTVGGKIVTFDVPTVSEAENSAHRMTLGKITVECEKDSELAVKAQVPFKGTYGGVVIENLVIDEKIVLK